MKRQCSTKTLVEFISVAQIAFSVIAAKAHYQRAKK